ncbi:unnamed protein product, partial [marine sediment metagenome]
MNNLKNIDLTRNRIKTLPTSIFQIQYSTAFSQYESGMVEIP